MSKKYRKTPVVFTPEEISEKRKYIHDTMISQYGVSGNFSHFTPKNLEALWDLYDRVFFGGQISKKLRDEGSTLKFQTTSGGKTKSGGWCQTTKSPGRKHCHFTISFPVGLYLKLFRSGEKSLSVNGITCWDRLSCLQMVFEHESIHMIMQLYNYERRIISGPGKAIYDPHGKLFQCIVQVYFGHTDFRHSLQAGESEDILKLSDIKIGMKVKSVHKGQEIYGRVTKVMKKNIKWVEDRPVKDRVWHSHPTILKLIS